MLFCFFVVVVIYLFFIFVLEERGSFRTRKAVEGSKQGLKGILTGAWETVLLRAMWRFQRGTILQLKIILVIL